MIHVICLLLLIWVHPLAPVQSQGCPNASEYNWHSVMGLTLKDTGNIDRF